MPVARVDVVVKHPQALLTPDLPRLSTISMYMLQPLRKPRNAAHVVNVDSFHDSTAQNLGHLIEYRAADATALPIHLHRAGSGGTQSGGLAQYRPHHTMRQ